MKIIFDGYKLKHRNTGLYHFTAELVASLNKELKAGGDELELLVPANLVGVLGDQIKYRRLRWWNYLGIFAPMPHAVWHSPCQMSKFMPAGKTLTVVTVHDLNFLYEKSEKKQKRRLASLQKNINRADRVVAISNYSKNDLARHIDLGKHEVEVIYNGCNIYDGPLTAPSCEPEAPFLFGVGTILRKKNWHTLPALLVGNDKHLYLAGKLSSYAETIVQAAVELGVEGRVHLLGEIDQAHKHWYLANCEAFVFPSIAEGFGLPVIEAMYYGKPVFLSPHTSLPEVGGEFAYYFDPEFDPQKMRAILEQGLSHFALHGDSQAEKGYALSFSWDRAARAYVEIYKKLIEDQ